MGRVENAISAMPVRKRVEDTSSPIPGREGLGWVGFRIFNASWIKPADPPRLLSFREGGKRMAFPSDVLDCLFDERADLHRSPHSRDATAEDQPNRPITHRLRRIAW
jgi:hypothetical protein